MFEIEYSKNLATVKQAATNTGKPLARTFVTQLLVNFSLALDDASQFNCPTC